MNEPSVVIDDITVEDWKLMNTALYSLRHTRRWREADGDHDRSIRVAVDALRAEMAGEKWFGT